MPDINASLKTTINGKGPQHKLHRVNEFEFTEGSDGALHAKIVDKNGNPIDSSKTEVSNFPNEYPDSAVRQELESVKAELQSLKEHTFNTRLSGSNVEDNDAIPTKNTALQELEVLIDSEVIEPGSRTDNFYLNPNGASEIYIFVQIDVQPWTLSYRNQFGSVSPQNGFPELNRVGETHDRARPAISFPLGYNPEQGIPLPSTMNEAKDWGLPITDSEYFRIDNLSDNSATVTINILRIWR